jgi:SAM-dependent methyltransferase
MFGISPPKNAQGWEAMWAPYTEPTYLAVLAHIQPTDRIIDIGAGDLRLAKRMAETAFKVYAIEKNPCVLANAARPLPDNLIVLQGDARILEFPPDVTCGVLIMRHCMHFQQYAEKLRRCGANRLVSNARWRYEPEVINLQARRLPYEHFEMGWYACWCGATGFKSGPVERINPELMEMVYEVQGCPKCGSEFRITSEPK